MGLFQCQVYNLLVSYVFGYTLENLYVIPYEDAVLQHPDIFNINRAFCCMLGLGLLLVVVNAVSCVVSKNLKLFCISWSCSLYNGFFPDVDITERILRSISHNDCISSIVCFDCPFVFGKNCILNLTSHPEYTQEMILF